MLYLQFLFQWDTYKDTMKQHEFSISMDVHEMQINSSKDND